MRLSTWETRLFLLTFALLPEVAGCNSRVQIDVLNPSEGRPRFKFSSNRAGRGVDMDILTVRNQTKGEDICFLLISDPGIRRIEEWQYGQDVPGTRMEGCSPPLPAGRYQVRIKANNGTRPFKDFEVNSDAKP